MNWSNLKAAISAVIRTNNNQEITGAILQNTLNSIVNSVGANATFAGVATLSTNPGTPDGPTFWLVGQGGQYSNFNNTTVSDGVLGVFLFDNSTWTFTEVVDIQDIISTQLIQVNSKINNLSGVLSPNTTYDSSNYGYGSRVSVFYPLDNKTKQYKLDISNIIYSNTSLNVRLTNAINPFGSALVHSIGNVTSVTNKILEITRTDAELSSAKYLAIIANANDDGVSFDAALYLNEGNNMTTIHNEIEASAAQIKGKAVATNTEINIDLTNLLLDGAYIRSNVDIDEFKIFPSESFSCIIFRCKAGDIFEMNDWSGANVEARPYAIFNESGILLSNGSGTVTATITIPEDGYVVFNKSNTNNGTLTLKTTKNINGLSWGYAFMISQLQSQLKSSSTNLRDNINSLISALEQIIHYSSNIEGTGWNTNRIVKDATMTFNDGDILKYVDVPYINSNSSIKLSVYIYDENDNLINTYICPYEYREITGSYRFEIGCQLKVGYSVAFKGTRYKTLTTSNRFYDYSIQDYVNAYAYWIDFYVSRLDISDVRESIEDLKKVKKSIKVLLFGNSFTHDSISYVPNILKNVAPELDFVIGVGYIGGSGLVQHCASFTNTTQTLNGTSYSPRNYSYSKFASNNTAWVVVGSRDVSAMLSDENWDIVTFQQNGDNSYKEWATYFEPFIFKIHKALFDKVADKTFKLGWLLTHGSYSTGQSEQLTRWEGVVQNTQKIFNLTGTGIIFPYGTAVQNLRTTPLHSAGVGGDNEGFLADTAHLQEGIGTLVANYANAITILESAGIDCKSIIGEGTRVSKEWNTTNNTLTPNYGTSDSVKGITEDNVYTAQMAAIMACKFPYAVTDCNKFYTA